MKKVVAVIVHNNRLVDIKPENNSQWLCSLSNINRSIKVGITGIPTGITMKKTFISDTKFSTMRTGLGSVFWTNSHKTMPFSECFILYELPQLESAPIRDFSIENSSPIPSTYSCQVFHNEECPDFCFTYNTLTNDMVHITSKPFLSATQSFEMFFGRFCASTLKPCFEASEPTNMMFDIPEEMFIACYCNIINAEVNTNKVFDRANISINLFSNAKIKEEFSSSHKEFTFGYFPIRIFGKVSRNGYRGFNSTIDCGDTQNIIFDGETSLGIIPNTSIENGFRFGSFTAFISPLNCSNNELGLESWEVNPHIFIDSIIKFKIRLMLSPTRIDSIINSFGINRNGLSDKQIIFNLNLNNSSVFHRNMEEEYIYKTIGNEEDKHSISAIPPNLKRIGYPCLIIYGNKNA